MALLSFFSASGATWLSSGNYDISWYNATDTEFTISTPKQLAGLAYIVNNGYSSFKNKTIHLANDLDMSGNGWVPIGTGKSQYFKGNIDGGNHCVSGIDMDMSNRSNNFYYGFFSYLYNSSVKNLAIKGLAYFYIEDAAYPDTYLGGLAGYAESCSFENVSTDVSIDYYREKTNNFEYVINIGGVIGKAYKSSFKYCDNYASVYVTFGTRSTEYYKSGVVYVGGITGYEYNSKYICCANHSPVLYASVKGSCNTSFNHGIRIGGIAGDTGNSTLIQSCCNNAQSLTGKSYISGYNKTIEIGGISAHSDGSIYNCYSSTIDYTFNNYFYYGGICAYKVSGDQYYSANYSPSDLSPEQTYGSEGYSGSTSFSQSQMKTDDFLSELNIYTILNGTDYKWVRDESGFPYIDRNSAGISQVVYPDKKFTVNGNSILFNEVTFVYLYRIDGTNVFIGETTAIENLDNGLYIIKIGNKSHKILIK